VVVLAVTTVASLVKVRKDPDTKAHAGSVRVRSSADDSSGHDRRGQPR
jgi:tellurite resistance protein TerC